MTTSLVTKPLVCWVPYTRNGSRKKGLWRPNSGLLNSPNLLRMPCFPSEFLQVPIWFPHLNSFIPVNALSSLCEATGADVREVAEVVGMDPRIGDRFLVPGIGYCFYFCLNFDFLQIRWKLLWEDTTDYFFSFLLTSYDLLGLIYLCESYHLSTEAAYWRSVLSLNEHQKYRFYSHPIGSYFTQLTSSVSLEWS